jgi:hypothetical protein
LPLPLAPPKEGNGHSMFAVTALDVFLSWKWKKENEKEEENARYTEKEKEI